MVENVQHRDEFLGRLAAALLGGMVVAGGIGQRVALSKNVFHLAVVDAVVGVLVGENVVEIEDGHIVERVIVFAQPIVEQPVVEGARVFGVCAIRKRRRCDDDEKFVGARGEILEAGVVHVLRAADRHLLVRAGRVVRPPLQRGVREARLEHDDRVLAAGVRERARVRGILSALAKQRGHVGRRAVAGKPFGPVGNVGAVADGFRPPAVVRVTDEIVVLVERLPEVPVTIGQPVLPGGVMDEDKLDGAIRRIGVVGLAHRRGLCGGRGRKEQESPHDEIQRDSE